MSIFNKPKIKAPKNSVLFGGWNRYEHGSQRLSLKNF